MASSPIFKVYDSHGVYQASTKEPEAAACLMILYGDGATIRHGHTKIVWLQGTDGDAGESYDHAATTIYDRMYQRV